MEEVKAGIEFTFKDLVKIVPANEERTENYIVIGNRIASPRKYTEQEARKVINRIDWDVVATFVTILYDAYNKKVDMENHTDDMENRTDSEKESV